MQAFLEKRKPDFRGDEGEPLPSPTSTPSPIARASRTATPGSVDQAGAERLGASLYEVEPGQANAPYHWHTANEEMLLVVAGRISLRTPKGTRELEAGEVVAFPRGERGAHQVVGAGDGPARYLIVSEMRGPEIVRLPRLEQGRRARGGAGHAARA